MAENFYQMQRLLKRQEDLNVFRAILVTGPQRSGTTFMGKAIAHDMKRPYVDERVFGTANESLFTRVLNECQHCIIQAPAMMYMLEKGVPDDALVVVMRRELDDIYASQERINWNGDGKEVHLYGGGTDSAALKYQWWDANKHSFDFNYMEVQYESMSDHPLWVEKTLRSNFTSKQTELS